MKPFILILWLFPLQSIAQSFSLSANTGYGIADNTPNKTIADLDGSLKGVRIDLAAEWLTRKQIVLGADYEDNLWSGKSNLLNKIAWHNHSYGVHTGYVSKWWEIDAGIRATFFKPIYKNFYGNLDNYTFNTKLSYNIQAGCRQKIGKRLYIREYIGCTMYFMDGNRYVYLLGGLHGPYSVNTTFNESFAAFYLRIGLSYTLKTLKNKKEQ